MVAKVLSKLPQNICKHNEIKIKLHSILYIFLCTVRHFHTFKLPTDESNDNKLTFFHANKIQTPLAIYTHSWILVESHSTPEK